MGISGEILPFVSKEERKRKLEWLVDNGYISFVGSEMVMSCKALAILGDIDEGVLRGLIALQLANGCSAVDLAPDVIAYMGDGAMRLMDRYKTDDAVEIIYNVANGIEVYNG